MIESILRFTGVYHLYTKLLKRQIFQNEMPKHIGLILDGNRRWSYKKRIKINESHREGGINAERLVKWCVELNVNTLTLYVLSLENFKRNQSEIKEILYLLEKYVNKAYSDDEIMKEEIMIKFIGDITSLPKTLVTKIKNLEEKTINNENLCINIAIGYGGKQEIIDATKKIVKDVINKKININDVNENLFENYLYTSHLKYPDIDLVIRTSGEKRLSGFLIWQSAYSEILFLDVYWPEFRKIDLMRAIRIYQKRLRRFGS